MHKNHDIITLKGHVIYEGRVSFLFSDGRLDEKGHILKAWLPKSKCAWNAIEKKMQVPEWLAKEKGLI